MGVVQAGAAPVFLTAEWRNLVMLNYAVEAYLLAPFVPSGTVLDEFEGRIYISLVAFEFNRSRVLGFPVPFHQAFEEVNLRFYVKRGTRRGVVFIRELVPKRAVAAIARLMFHENYSFVPMSYRIQTGTGSNKRHVEYSWWLGADRCKIEIETEGDGSLPAEGSEEQFVTEHYWGYSAQPDGSALEYEVRHEPWRVCKPLRAGFTGNVASLYGRELAAVLKGEPRSAFLAEGSPVTVFRGTRVDLAPLEELEKSA